MRENIAIFLSFRSGSCCGIALDLILSIQWTIQGFNRAVFKICGRTSKDKVDIAADIAVFIVMSAIDARCKLFGTDKTARFDLLWRERTGKQCVLMTKQSAMVEKQPVSIGIKGDRLSMCFGITGSIFDR